MLTWVKPVGELLPDAYAPETIPQVGELDELDDVLVQPDVQAIIAKTTNLVIQETIDILRILVLPTGEVKSGFRPFTLEVASLNYPPPSNELWVQHLRTNRREIIGLQQGAIDESRLEDYKVYRRSTDKTSRQKAFVAKNTHFLSWLVILNFLTNYRFVSLDVSICYQKIHNLCSSSSPLDRAVINS